jgi:hypothetical protein
LNYVWDPTSSLETKFSCTFFEEFSAMPIALPDAVCRLTRPGSILRRCSTIRTRFAPSACVLRLGHRTMKTSAPSPARIICAASAAGGTPAGASGASRGGARSLERLAWNNKFAETLPADPDTSNRTRQVENAIFTRVDPTPTGTEPTFIIGSSSVAELIGLDPAEFSRPEFAMIFSGNAKAPGSDPYAQCYGGHQFGHWAGQLGDGRALSLGEVEGCVVGPLSVRRRLRIVSVGSCS